MLFHLILTIMPVCFERLFMIEDDKNACLLVWLLITWAHKYASNKVTCLFQLLKNKLQIILLSIVCDLLTA